MAFVPEGQHDSSKARSAWNHEENISVPAGRLNRSRRRSDAGDKSGHELSFDDKYLWTRLRPPPQGRSLSPSLPRHFVPGYYQPVPPGQKPFVYRSASQVSELQDS